MTPLTRWLLALGAPLLGALLLYRQVRVALRRGRHLGPLLRALPLLIAMDAMRGAGEFVGYATGRATSRRL